MTSFLPDPGTTRFNYSELIHPRLYGSLPSASRPQLPVLKPVDTASIVPLRLVPFHEAYAHKGLGAHYHKWKDGKPLDEEPHPLTPAMKKLLKNVSDLK